MLIFLPSCCRGFDKFFIKGANYNFSFSFNLLYILIYTDWLQIVMIKWFISIDGLKINSSNWYQHIRIKDLESYIHEGRHIGYLQFDPTVKTENPAYGQLMDSQLSEEGYSVYFNAEIISVASYHLRRHECKKYKHTEDSIKKKHLITIM